MRCNICGSQTSSNLVIHDKKWNVYGDAKVCKSCFDLWSSGNEDALIKKVGEKFKR